MSLARHQCKHNLGYWDLSQYLGFGPSAHSFIENVRFRMSAMSRLMEAMERDTEGAGAFLGTTNALGSLAVDEFTKNAYRDNVAEYIFTGLRKNAGISYKSFEERFGKRFGTFTAKTRDAYLEFVRTGSRGEEDDAGIRLTLKGV